MNSDGVLFTMNPLEKNNKERNPTSENIPYLLSNKTFFGPDGKIHTLSARKGKYFSKTIIEISNSFISQDSHRNIIHQENEVL